MEELLQILPRSLTCRRRSRIDVLDPLAQPVSRRERLFVFYFSFVLFTRELLYKTKDTLCHCIKPLKLLS